MNAREFIRTRTMAQHAGLAMITAGLIAFFYQAWKNARTATRYSEGSDWYIDAIGGIAPELFVAAAAVGIISLSHKGKLTSKRSLHALMALCVGFGVFASFQQITVGRINKAADNSMAAKNLEDRATELKRIEGELANMTNVPALATATSALDKLKTRKGWNETNGCANANPGGYTVLCRQVADHKRIIGAAQRKETLETRQRELSSKNERVTGSQVSKADPAAEGLAAFTGWQMQSAQMVIAGFMAVVMMLVGMFGVHFGLVVYGMDETEAQPTAAIVPFKAPAHPVGTAHVGPTSGPMIPASLKAANG